VHAGPLADHPRNPSMQLQRQGSRPLPLLHSRPPLWPHTASKTAAPIRALHDLEPKRLRRDAARRATYGSCASADGGGAPLPDEGAIAVKFATLGPALMQRMRPCSASATPWDSNWPSVWPNLEQTIAGGAELQDPSPEFMPAGSGPARRWEAPCPMSTVRGRCQVQRPGWRQPSRWQPHPPRPWPQAVSASLPPLPAGGAVDEDKEAKDQVGREAAAELTLADG
jgi:hypothetical protein